MMYEQYLSVKTEAGKMLYLSPLSDRQISLCSEDIEDSSGYFLFEREGEGDSAPIHVLARLVSDDAVEAMRAMLGME
ncbi:hypothetical protein C3731_20600 [Brucella oryzae]|uniref:Uncharacterized protein n=1 Tax=Brucella oryzae TaxID=335286 RepID=A0A2S7IUT9_9HYPH|nr:hypothetical protein C3731_20600 [Brucella oryzae]